MTGRNFIGGPQQFVKPIAVNAVRLDADFILAREGLRLTANGVANGLGIVLAESKEPLTLDEWKRQLER